jgi:hypothetical protein
MTESETAAAAKADRYGIAAALLLLATAALVCWCRDQLYFGRLPIGGTIAAAGINLLVLIGALVGAAAVLLPRRFLVLARTSLVLGVAMVIYETAGPMAPWAVGSGRALKLVVAGLVAGLGLWLARRLSDGAWRRLARATGVASIAFVGAAYLLVNAGADAVAWPPPARADSGAAPSASGRMRSAPRNVVFILLDELGDTAAPPVARAIAEAGFSIASKSLDAAGADTINVIPAMFTRKNFDHAAPCGISAICSGTHVLDFSRIHVTRPDVDVVGLYHPYCRIPGLRSCFQLEGPQTFENPYLRLLNVYLARLGRPILDSDPEAPASGAGKQGDVDRMVDAMMQAPFWRSGGVLYAHLPLPHPPSLSGWHSLDADYAANIEVAAALVSRVSSAARRRFGDEVRIVVTADHALRPRIWCSDSVFNGYHGQGCALRPEFRATKVPLIVGGAPPTRLDAITSNRDVFDAITLPRQ